MRAPQHLVASAGRLPLVAAVLRNAIRACCNPERREVNQTCTESEIKKFAVAATGD
jgi:hypothetical protein